jgi:hypothetical protein
MQRESIPSASFYWETKMAEAVSITIDLSKFHLENLGRSITTAASKQIKQEMSEIVRTAKKDHRYTHRTRNLEKSTLTNDAMPPLTAEGHLDDGIAFYGKFIHQGFRTWSPDQFLYNALDQRKEQVQHNIEMAIEEAIRKEQ